MSQLVKTITIGGRIGDQLSDELDVKVISDILSYIYGDKKTTKQIAKRLGIHLLQAVLYLDYMLRKEMILCTEEEGTYGLERYFYVEEKGSKVSMETKVDGNPALLKVANEMGEKTKDIIVSLNKDDLQNISYTISMISDEDAKQVLEAQKKIEDLMTELENKPVSEDSKTNRYIFMSTFAPYKFETEEEPSGEDYTDR